MEAAPIMWSFLLRGSRRAVLSWAAFMIALVAFADWRIKGPFPLGFLYLFPMLLAGGALHRWQLPLVAAFCTFLTEAFDETFAWFPQSGVPRDILIFSAFLGTGLFASEVVRSHRREQLHLSRIEDESEARRVAEEQLKILVESSPAAIFTMNSAGSVLLANNAAHRMFGVPADTFPGRSVREYLPSLINVAALGQSRPAFRTVMQCRGRREDGEVFLADIWFSTYNTSAGSRLAAMVFDTSEELRTREELSLHQLLSSSRILVGAVSHEIRNVCGAIAVVHENMARGGALAGNKDFEALGTLIVALEKIAAMELRQTAHHAARVDLAALLEELRIVVEPSLRESGIDVRWDTDENLPVVWADRHSLMQVFLNITRNSERAMLDRPRRELTVSARRAGDRMVVRFRDTGCGVSHPERLFRPFQHGADAAGLGLYLSRAFMRSFRGELHYEPEPDGSSFVVDLAPVSELEADDKNTAGGRSQSVSREPQPAAPGRA
jgi:PAS domain S-box-containing protein